MAFFNNGWVGSLIGIVGILLSVYFYFKDKIGARLDYQMAELKILDRNNLALGMEVKYLDKPITRLVRTQIVIWNSGRKTIEGNNVVKDDPLRLTFDTSEVLSCNIAHYSRKINRCAVIIDENFSNSIIFKFEFLDPKDGVVIDILHTGEEVYPKFIGNIKGMKDKIKNRGIAPYPLIEVIPKKAKIILLLPWLALLVMNGLLITVGLYTSTLITGKDIPLIVLGFSISFGVLLGTSNLGFFKRRKAPAKSFRN